MIIDADCHISSDKVAKPLLTADILVEHMDEAGVDRAIIWLIPPYNKDIAPENRAVYKATLKYPKKLIGFGWANPRLGNQATYRTISQCFEEYGMWGIKFNGAQDDYVIDDEELVMPFIEYAAKYNKPIAFHIGADYYENTHPFRLGNIAARFPEIRFLMVHMGGAGLPALDRSAVEIAKKYSNITLIGSGIQENAILRAIHTLGPERVCFGSDTPFRLMHVQLAMYKALLRDYNKPFQDLILGENIDKLLGI